MSTTLVLTPPEKLKEYKTEQVLNLEKKHELVENEQRRNELTALARQFTNEIFQLNENSSPDIINQKVIAIQNMGQDEMQKTAKLSNSLLQMNLKSMSESDKTSSQQNIANQLINLRMKIDNLSPQKNGIDFSVSGVVKNKKLFGIIPLPSSTADKMKRYFLKYESGEKALDEVMQGLENGKQLLIKNNDILAREKVEAWQNLINLKEHLFVKQEIVNEIEANMARNNVTPEMKAAVIDKMLFPLEQTINDITVQITIATNGYMCYDNIQKNNNVLINGVERCKTTTMTALRQAVTIANALYGQKIVLHAINTVTETTENLILQNSAMLKNNTVQIHQQATSSTIRPEVLVQSFNDIYETEKAISEYSQNALLILRQNNAMIQGLNNKMEELIIRKNDVVAALNN